jgi:chromosome segregation ATPase
MKHTEYNFHARMFSILLGTAMFTLSCSHAVADDKKDKQERMAQFRLQQMQLKLEQDKAALEQENATLKEQLKKIEKRHAKQKQEMKEAEAEISNKETQLLSCHRDAENAQLAAQHKLEQSETLNKQLTEEKSRLENALAEQKDEVHACQVKNASLISMFKEMANKYEKTALKSVEPFTGLSGVDIENHFQDSIDQAETQLFKPRK